MAASGQELSSMERNNLYTPMRKQFIGCIMKLEYGKKKRSVLIGLKRSQPRYQLLVAEDVAHLLLIKNASEKEHYTKWNITRGHLFY